MRFWKILRMALCPRSFRAPFGGNVTSAKGYERRIEDVVESMHAQRLYLLRDNRRSVSVLKLSAYFSHLERMLYGFERGDADIRPVRKIVGSQDTKEDMEHGRAARLS